MRNIILPFLLLAFSAYGQQTSVAVLPSEGTLSDDENGALTDEMREAALKVLPTNAFILLKQDVVVKRLGGAENYIKECSESSCIVDLGKKAQVDYVAQASVGKLGNEIRLKVELYNVRTEGLVGMFNDEAENFKGLLAVVKKRAPAEVFGKMPGASVGSRAVSPLVAGGISGLQISSGDYEVNGGKRYLASIASDPEGASLSFNGIPDAHCTKTPCSVELGEGSVRIIANLEQYEMADTTVSINRNKQSIDIRMKPNFGVLEIKPAYSDGIGKDEEWNLTINGESYSSLENRLSPGEYEVKLSHECYEDISFKAGINKGKDEIIDMAKYIKLKKGGLVLSAEVDDEPASELVFVNGTQVGETPFSGSVPVCARVEIGDGKETVDVKIKHNKTEKYQHKMDTEERKRRLAEEQAKLEAEERLAQVEKQKQAAQEEEQAAWHKKQTAWHASGYLGIGMPVMVNSIDSNYSSLGFQFSASFESLKPSISFFRFGMNIDAGFLGYDEDAIKKISPDADSIVSVTGFVKGGAFARLYPVSFIYLSGGANFGYYGGNDGISKSTGKKVAEIKGTSTAIFPVGAGLVFGFLGPDDGIAIDALYNIVMLKKGYGAYWSFNIGRKFGRK